MPIQTVKVVAHEMTVMRPGPVPDQQQRLLEMSLERFEEIDSYRVLNLANFGTGQVAYSLCRKEPRLVV